MLILIQQLLIKQVDFLFHSFVLIFNFTLKFNNTTKNEKQLKLINYHYADELGRFKVRRMMITKHEEFLKETGYNRFDKVWLD